MTATGSWSNDYKGHRDDMKILSPEFQCVLPQRATRRQLWKENHACYPGLTSMKKKKTGNKSILIYALQSWRGMLATRRAGWRESKGVLRAITSGLLWCTSPSLTGLARTATRCLKQGARSRGRGISPPELQGWGERGEGKNQSP